MKDAYEEYAEEMISGGDEKEEVPVTPLRSLAFRASDLAGQPVPTRKWDVDKYIPSHVPVLLYGDGGVGKTTAAMQLGVCRSAGLPWLGIETMPGRTLGFFAEDEKPELHIRLNDIRAGLDLSWGDLDDFVAVPVAGEDFVLGEFDARRQRVIATPRLAEIEEMARDSMTDCIILDTLSDIYAGEENNRQQVRQFITLLRGVCKRAEVTIIGLAHPSLRGMADGTGGSGTTGWSNGARARMYFYGNDDDTKTLQVMKSNYGPTDLNVTLRWQDGLYVPVTETDVAVNEEGDDMIFLTMLDAYTKQERNVSPNASNSYAPTVFAKDPACKRDKKKMQDAMNRLFSAGRIKSETFGRASKERTRLVRA